MAAGVRRNSLWAITTYFNPLKYTKRHENFKEFKRHLEVPLVVVELARNSDFELTKADAEVVVWIRGESVMWQKERLLNIALESLPSHVEYVAWLDCDIVLEAEGWAQNAIASLKKSRLTQLFSSFHDVPMSWAQSRESWSSVEQIGTSIACLIEAGSFSNSDVRPTSTIQMRKAAFGLAWAAETSLMRTHGFYDRMIMGSGDRALACAAFGRLDDAIETIKLNDRRTQHYRTWAEKLLEDVAGRVTYLNGKLFHLWHGDLAHRHYAGRHVEFAKLNFDPEQDISLNLEGAFEWTGPNAHALQAFATGYFESRMEDGDWHGRP